MKKSKLKVLTVVCLSTMLLSACGGAHEHTYVEHAAVDATCETAGNKKYYTCSAESCKDKFFDADKKEATWDQIKINALGHHIVSVAGKHETCTEEGYKDAFKCDRCSIFYEDEAGKTKIGDATAFETWKTTEGKGKIAKHDADLGDLIPEVDKHRETDGMKAHYACKKCGQLYDDKKVISSADALKIANTLHVVEAAAEAKADSDYIPFEPKSDVIYLDVKVDSDETGIFIGFMDKTNGWKRTHNAQIFKNGTFKHSDIPVKEAKGDGVYILGKTTDDYVRVKFDLAKMVKEEGFVGVTDIIIYKWAHSSGKIDINPSASIKTKEMVLAAANPMGKGATFDFPTRICRGDGKLVLTLNFNTTDEVVKQNFMLGDGWNDYIGYYEVKSDGTLGAEYKGLTAELKETAVVITIDLDAAIEDTNQVGNPSRFNLLFFHSSWGTGTGTYSLSFFANDLVY